MALSSVQGKTVRAAAILTGSAVASSLISLPQTATQKLTWLVDFTLGSLTNGVFTPQVSPDGTNWFDVTDPGALTLTADGKKAIFVECTGMKLARVTVKGNGTATSSSATVTANWQRS